MCSSPRGLRWVYLDSDGAYRRLDPPDDWGVPDDWDDEPDEDEDWDEDDEDWDDDPDEFDPMNEGY